MLVSECMIPAEELSLCFLSVWIVKSTTNKCTNQCIRIGTLQKRGAGNEHEEQENENWEQNLT